MTDTGRSRKTVSLPAPPRDVPADEPGGLSLEHIVFQGDAHSQIGERPGVRPGLNPVRRPAAPSRTHLDPALARFYDRLFELSNLRISYYRASVLKRRGPACLRALRVEDPGRAVELLSADTLATERALRAAMIGVTSFFRDPRVLRGLEPFLVQMSRNRVRGLRVLSVGCSDGSEVYSIAIRLRELGIEVEALDGVDCRSDAIRMAQSGVYPRDRLAHVPEQILSRFFKPHEADKRGALQVIDEIRDRCRWRIGDALELPEGPQYDLVVCRNLVIYLKPESAARLWRKLAGHLEPDGLLMVGKAERPMPDQRLDRIGPSLYRRRHPEHD